MAKPEEVTIGPVREGLIVTEEAEEPAAVADEDINVDGGLEIHMSIRLNNHKRKGARGGAD